MTNKQPTPKPRELNEPFKIKDCTLIALATGVRVHNLRELRDKLEIIDSGSIYYHFWGSRLRARFDDPEYNNDFAAWARHGLHDWILAERLGTIDPTEFDNLKELRQEIIEIIEQRLDESEYVPWAKTDHQFAFATSQIVVFNTSKHFKHPEALGHLVPYLSIGSIFYHFIDARRRAPLGVDDFSKWLMDFNGLHKDLVKEIARVDPYFATLTEIRSQLAQIFESYFGVAA
ncbi:hypothetical protein HQ585_21035 [candidate division KSB1 bacterium]|nr:hypothetical protein [candidate division KSB1 bacterium]